MDGLVQDEEEARIAGKALAAGDDAVDRPGARADRKSADRRPRASSRTATDAEQPAARRTQQDRDDELPTVAPAMSLGRQVHLGQRRR